MSADRKSRLHLLLIPLKTVQNVPDRHMQKVDQVCLDPEQRSEGPLGTVGVGKGVAGPQWRWSRGLT